MHNVVSLELVIHVRHYRNETLLSTGFWTDALCQQRSRGRRALPGRSVQSWPTTGPTSLQALSPTPGTVNTEGAHTRLTRELRKPSTANAICVTHTATCSSTPFQPPLAQKTRIVVRTLTKPSDSPMKPRLPPLCPSGYVTQDLLTLMWSSLTEWSYTTIYWMPNKIVVRFQYVSIRFAIYHSSFK